MAAGSQQMSVPVPPSELTADMAVGCQDAVALLLKHGLGKRRLDVIAKDAGKVSETKPIPACIVVFRSRVEERVSSVLLSALSLTLPR